MKKGTKIFITIVTILFVASLAFNWYLYNHRSVYLAEGEVTKKLTENGEESYITASFDWNYYNSSSYASIVMEDESSPDGQIGDIFSDLYSAGCINGWIGNLVVIPYSDAITIKGGSVTIYYVEEYQIFVTSSEK